MREQLTVLIPCKNESHDIQGCIASVRPIADEILVADSGSVDGTQGIVRSLGGCRLIEREFVNFADFKNWALPQASHSWVLIVDADERVTDELAAEILDILKDPAPEIDGYRINFRCYFLGRELKYARYNNSSVRLVRRDRCRYVPRRVHERMQIAPSRTGQLRAKFLHYSYLSYDEYLAKGVNYTRWGAEEMWDQGKRTNWRGLLLRPTLRFIQLYILRRGFLDGLAGLQICMLGAYFNTFIKQGRLWEMEQLAKTQPRSQPAQDSREPRLSPSIQVSSKHAA